MSYYGDPFLDEYRRQQRLSGKQGNAAYLEEHGWVRTPSRKWSKEINGRLFIIGTSEAVSLQKLVNTAQDK
jgi:hypothetical protein